MASLIIVRWTHTHNIHRHTHTTILTDTHTRQCSQTHTHMTMLTDTDQKTSNRYTTYTLAHMYTQKQINIALRYVWAQSMPSMVGCRDAPLSLVFFSQELPWSEEREPFGNTEEAFDAWPRPPCVGAVAREFRADVANSHFGTWQGDPGGVLGLDICPLFSGWWRLSHAVLAQALCHLGLHLSCCASPWPLP